MNSIAPPKEASTGWATALTSPPAATASQPLTEQDHQVEGQRHQDRDRAGDDDAGREGEVAAGVDLGAEPARGDEHRQGRDRHRAHGCDPQPGDDLRRRQGQLHPPEHLALAHPHPASRLLDRIGDVGEPRHRVAVEDLQRVGAERDDRGVAPQAGDRQQQEEEGEAGDRVEDPGRGEQRRLQPAPPVREQRQGEGDAEPDHDGDHDHLQVLEGRRPVAVDVFPRPVPAEQVGGPRLAGQALAFFEEAFADFPDRGEQGRASHRAAPPPAAARRRCIRRSSPPASRGTRR